MSMHPCALAVPQKYSTHAQQPCISRLQQCGPALLDSSTHAVCTNCMSWLQQHNCAVRYCLHNAGDFFATGFVTVGKCAICKSTACDNEGQQLLNCCLHNAGDSFTIGFANVGNYTTCKSTACNPISGGCMPDLETEDASVGWGPLTAGNFTADFQAKSLYSLCFNGPHSFRF